MGAIIRIHFIGKLFSQKPDLSKHQIIQCKNKWLLEEIRDDAIERIWNLESKDKSCQFPLMSRVLYFQPTFVSPSHCCRWGGFSLTEPHLGCTEYLSPCSFSSSSAWALGTHSAILEDAQHQKCERLKLCGEPLINGEHELVDKYFLLLSLR